MITLKDVEKSINVARRWVISLQSWTSLSIARLLFVLLLLEAAQFGAGYLYLNHLVSKDTAETHLHEQAVSIMGKELDYHTAIAAISTCLDSNNDSAKLHTWYCDQAVTQYRLVSENRPQGRVKEIVSLLAYRAMREDVRGYLQGLQLQRLADAPPTGTQAILKTILSKTAVAFWAIVVSFLNVGAYLVLWVLPRYKKVNRAQNNSTRRTR